METTALCKTICGLLKRILCVWNSYFSLLVTYSTILTQFYSPFPRDNIFGSLGTNFQYKWHGNGYAHPHIENNAQQTLHWACLATKNDMDSVIILVTPYNSNTPPYITNHPNKTIFAIYGGYLSQKVCGTLFKKHLINDQLGTLENTSSNMTSDTALQS